MKETGLYRVLLRAVRTKKDGYCVLKWEDLTEVLRKQVAFPQETILRSVGSRAMHREDLFLQV